MCGEGFNMNFVIGQCMGTVGSQDMVKIGKCIEKECEFLGKYLVAITDHETTCNAQGSSASCREEALCMWTGAACEVDASTMALHLMKKLIPDGCAFKNLFEHMLLCTPKTTKDACTTESSCEWTNEDECTESMDVKSVETCGMHPTAVMDMIVSGSGSDDTKTMAFLMKAATQCAQAGTSNDCTEIETEWAWGAHASGTWTPRPLAFERSLASLFIIVAYLSLLASLCDH
eukprot:gnl/TRDRNA2_/TRDRNA2_83629_c0_seq1.p1 gnl/TRDRNA2_/TRDRNA2_83629_c0~~gnl/TRDRNA2_/TRDRNA2_83629_c0_seq1.p1  ORF type:complete len:257 (-),score=35.27 gnl/TRDRNA2_/TRDRNA2_83629_c0_seq1:120-812(-)